MENKALIEKINKILESGEGVRSRFTDYKVNREMYLELLSIRNDLLGEIEKEFKVDESNCEKMEYYEDFYTCPSCGEGPIFYQSNFCPDCGVKLVWNDTED